MDSAHAAIAVQTLIALALLIWLLSSLIPNARLDSYRQRLFAVRDELFDYAADGHISFDDPAYRLLRKSVNGFIRYGHQLTFFRICMTAAHWKLLGQPPKLEWGETWTRALEGIDDIEVRSKLNLIHAEVMAVVVKRIFAASPALWLAMGLVLLGMVAHHGWENSRLSFKQAAAKSLEVIVDPRLLEEEAARCMAA